MERRPRPCRVTPPQALHTRVWALAGPIILSNLSVPLVGAVDTAVVGHLPDPVFIGAVALGAVIFSFLYWGFGFLRMGTTGFVAQALGAGDSTEVHLSLARALLLGICLGLALVAAQAPLAWAGFSLLQTTPALEALTSDYFHARIWSAPATLANYALLGFLIGIQRTRDAFILQLVLNLSNVALDLWFVTELGWGVKGVGLASVLAEYVALAAGLLLARRNLRRIGGDRRRGLLLDSHRIRALIQVNANIFVRTLCLIVAFAWFTVTSSRMGELTLAVNAVLMHLQSLMAYALDGFAHAAEALAGSAYGARERAAFRAAVRVTSIWALAVSLLIALLYAAAGSTIIGWLTDIEAVRSAAVQFLPWLIALPPISVWSFQLDGIFIGTTRTAEMRNGMLISLLVYLMATALLAPALGNHGLWLALVLFMVARALTLGYWYARIERTLD